MNQKFPHKEKKEISNEELMLLLASIYNIKASAITKLEGGAINQTYLIETVDKLFVLRVYSLESYLGDRNERVIQEEIDFLIILKSNGLNVSNPLANNNNCYITRHENRFIVLFEYIDASQAWDSLNEDHLFTAGQSIGQIHQVSVKTNQQTSRKWRDHPLIEYSLQHLSIDKQPKQLELNESIMRLQSLLISYKLRLDRLPMFTLHGDFHLNNILFTKGQAFIIDFDSMHIGHLHEDIANFFILNIFKSVILGKPYAPSIDGIKAFFIGYQFFVDLNIIDYEIIYIYLELFRTLLWNDYLLRLEPDKLEEFVSKSDNFLNQFKQYFI